MNSCQRLKTLNSTINHLIAWYAAITKKPHGQKKALAIAVKNNKAIKCWSMLEERCARTHSLPKLGQHQAHSAEYE